MEIWAQQHGYDRLLTDWEGPAIELIIRAAIQATNFMVSDLVIGFAIGGFTVTLLGSVAGFRAMKTMPLPPLPSKAPPPPPLPPLLKSRSEKPSFLARWVNL